MVLAGLEFRFKLGIIPGLYSNELGANEILEPPAKKRKQYACHYQGGW
jgi:hypothetical protein